MKLDPQLMLMNHKFSSFNPKLPFTHHKKKIHTYTKVYENWWILLIFKISIVTTP